MSRLGLGVALALATFGCAQEREPISRVQPNAMKKSFFVGEKLLETDDDPEFHFRGSLVDTGYGAGQDGLFTSTYAMPVSRIKWQVNEGMLVARLSYERIDDTDGKYGTVKGNEGQVVAAFAIQSHFDIRRSYNPVTGEEQNVVEENVSDRPWYEREFFRVDWSKNLVTNAYDFDTLSMIGVFGGVTYEPMSYYVNDPTHPDAPVFGDGYFDITQKVFATPQVINFAPELAALFGVSSFPACMLDADIGGGSGPTSNCNPQELKLRLSFNRVVDTDYEAQDWDGVRFQAFGAFTLNFNGRMGYTRPYGIVDEKNHRFIERYNIWQRSHYYADPAAMTGAVVCGTADTGIDTDGDGKPDDFDSACQAVTDTLGVGGSRCDVYAKKCTLPFRNREHRPIVWFHLDGTTDPTQLTQGDVPSDGSGFDSRDGGLFEPTDWATQEWDLAIKSARTTAKYVECKRMGDADCDSLYPVWHGQMDDQEDADRLAREVNFCRRQVNKATHTPENLARGVRADYSQCDAVADERAAAWNITDPAVIATVKQPAAVILCHSPVADEDADECFTHPAFPAGTKREDMRARLGDLRFSVVNTINTPQTPSSWGIMVDAKDPINGETVSASINIWNHVTDLASQGAVDIIRYINGELSTSEITDGKFIKDWVIANEGTAGGSRIMPPMSKDEVVQRIAGTAISKDSAASAEAVRKSFDSYITGQGAQTANEIQQLKQVKDVARGMRASSMAPSSNAARLQARLEHARGTDFESQLVNTAALESLGIDPAKGSPAQGAREYASPLRNNNPLVASRIKKLRDVALGERGACVLEAAPEFSGIIGLAEIMKEKFPVVEGENPLKRAERMRRYIARRYQYGVIIHEMGHSFGERHNFISSYDALHFRPQYWQLRTKNGSVNKACTDAQTLEGAENCVGPRYFDPVTQQETQGLQWMWQQSSVMDYPGDISLDTLGLGAYDFAAARMFYGESTSVYQNNTDIAGNGVNAGWVIDSDNDGFSDNVEKTAGTNHLDQASKPTKAQATKIASQNASAISITSDISGRMDDFGGIVGLKTGDAHYSQHQKKFNLIHSCQEITSGDGEIVGDPQMYRPSDWNEEIDGYYHNVVDARVVAVDGKYTRCRQQPVDYVNWSELRSVPQEPDLQAIVGNNPPAVDSQDRLRVPYPFATDHWADSGNASVFRHDQGADPYEQFMFWMGSQENRFIFDHYRRGRTTFAIRPTMNRDFERYTEKAMNEVKGLGLYRNLYANGYLTKGWAGVAGSSFLADNSVAASLAMDHFSRQLTRPQDGDHFLYSVADMWAGAEDEPSIFRSSDDTIIIDPSNLSRLGKSPARISIPTGSAGYLMPDADGVLKPTAFRAVSYGGQPIHNSLDRNKGDYSSSYQLSVGSYYAKINAVMALTESQDNFISASRGDFVDARYRATSIADLYPEGFRRLIGAALTDDKDALGPRIAGTKEQFPTVTYDNDTGSAALTPSEQAAANAKFCANNANACAIGENGVPYPKQPMAWTSWWPETGPQSCWTTDGSQICYQYDDQGNLKGDGFKQNPPASSFAIDPEIGWEVQKYIIAWTYLYLPENNVTEWFDMMRIYRGYEVPSVQGKVVRWRDPQTGVLYQAKSFGQELINGRMVEKGIAARVLQRANELTAKAYEVDSTDADTGEHTLVLNGDGFPVARTYQAGFGDIDQNPYIANLKNYKSIPDFMVQAGDAYGLTEGGIRGVY